jgi:hypothetical protein
LDCPEKAKHLKEVDTRDLLAQEEALEVIDQWLRRTANPLE